MTTLIAALVRHWPYGLVTLLTGCAVAATPRVLIGRSIGPGDPDDVIDEWWTLQTGQLPGETPGGDR